MCSTRTPRHADHLGNRLVSFESSFELDVYHDVVVPQEALSPPAPGGKCVPMRSENRCSYFDVSKFSGTPDFPRPVSP